MAVFDDNTMDAMPVVRDPKDFDHSSGDRVERIIFNYRGWILLACALLTVFMVYQLTYLKVNANYERMLPSGHQYIKNYLESRTDLRGLGNIVRIVVENPNGTIFDAAYLEKLRDINDMLFLTPGVDRAFLKSLWTPLLRWNEVTEEGFRGGPVVPPDYDGSERSIAQLKYNVERAHIVGSFVAADLKSSMIVVPLLDTIAETGERLDYGAFTRHLEERVRAKYEGVTVVGDPAQAKQTGGKQIYMVGFAMLMGALIAGLYKVMSFFALAAVIAAAMLYAYTRCIRSTLLVILAAIIAVTWQLGTVAMLGFDLDPYSLLVPFLVFAIGVSHGAQKMNGIMQDVGRGTHKYVAARYTYRRLFMAGLMALLTEAVGFGVLMIIDIQVIRDLALTASIGVGLLVFTCLILLPILLSYVGVSKEAGLRSLRGEEEEKKGYGLGAVWNFLDRFTERRWAIAAIAVTAVLTAVSFAVSLDLKIGDLDAGAPELRPNSRYNMDNAFIASHYGQSSDLFAVIVKTPAQGCSTYKTQIEMDRLAMELENVAGVQATRSLSQDLTLVVSGSYEGNLKWLTINRIERVLASAQTSLSGYLSDVTTVDCNITPILVYLADHRAETLDRVMGVVERFNKEHGEPDMQFLPAAGSAGVEAVTNIVVRESNRTMLIYVYASMLVLCYITFRSWRAVIVAVVPLGVTSILCEALMVMMGIGVKVATLPVIALGVGIGIDYALYLLAIQLDKQREGQSLKDAYKGALGFTGRVVALVGFTMAAGVITWAWSPIKFQADMGILLTFMFLWNMLGALVMIPALSHFLLRNEGIAARKATAKATGPAD